MKKLALLTLLSFVAAIFVPASMMAEDKTKRPSPPASASCTLADGKVTIDYSSPRVKGRKIFGDLVPYGKIWRTGANEATTFVTTTNVSVGGTDVPAGNYTIFTVPEAGKWTLVISKTTGEWGTDYSGEANDFARVPMTVSKTSGPVENFTIAFEQAGNKCTLHADWENTRASVDVVKK